MVVTRGFAFINVNMLREGILSLLFKTGIRFQVYGMLSVVFVSCGGHSTAAIGETGYVYTWGTAF